MLRLFPLRRDNLIGDKQSQMTTASTQSHETLPITRLFERNVSWIIFAMDADQIKAETMILRSQKIDTHAVCCVAIQQFYGPCMINCRIAFISFCISAVIRRDKNVLQ